MLTEPHKGIFKNLFKCTWMFLDFYMNFCLYLTFPKQVTFVIILSEVFFSEGQCNHVSKKKVKRVNTEDIEAKVSDLLNI